VIITEFMPNPGAVADEFGEWLELYNPGTNPVDLSGWLLKDDGTDSHTITSLTIPAGGYAVLAKSTSAAENGGVPADYAYSDFFLGNSAPDEIVLVDGNAAEVDRVNYDSSWSFSSGISAGLKQNNLDNSVAANWCPGKDPWSGSDGDRGSPGADHECGSGPATCPHNPSKRLTFNEALCGALTAGTKKITIRNGHRTDVDVGDWAKLICSTSNTTFESQITVRRHTTYGEITQEEWEADGFASQSDMLEGLKVYYPDITLASDATVFRWGDITACE